MDFEKGEEATISLARAVWTELSRLLRMTPGHHSPVSVDGIEEGVPASIAGACCVLLMELAPSVGTKNISALALDVSKLKAKALARTANLAALGLKELPAEDILVKVFKKDPQGKMYTTFVRFKEGLPSGSSAASMSAARGAGTSPLFPMLNAVTDALSWGAVIGAISGVVAGAQQGRMTRELCRAVNDMPIGFLKRLLYDKGLPAPHPYHITDLPDDEAQKALAAARKEIIRELLREYRLEWDDVAIGVAEKAGKQAAGSAADGAVKAGAGAALQAVLLTGEGAIRAIGQSAAPFVVAATAVEISKDGYKAATNQITTEELGERASGHVVTAGSSYALAQAGMVIGAPLGPVGSVAGGLVGGLVGYVVGKTVGPPVIAEAKGAVVRAKLGSDRELLLGRMRSCLFSLAKYVEGRMVEIEEGTALTINDGYIGVSTYWVTLALLRAAGLRLPPQQCIDAWECLATSDLKHAPYDMWESWVAEKISAQVLSPGTVQDRLDSLKRRFSLPAFSSGSLQQLVTKLTTKSEQREATVETEEQRKNAKCVSALCAMLSDDGLARFLRDRLVDCSAIRSRDELVSLAAGYGASIAKQLTFSDLDAMDSKQMVRLLEDEDVWVLTPLERHQVLNLLAAQYASLHDGLLQIPET